MAKQLVWIEIKIESYAEHVNHLSDQLMLLGASAVTLQDAANQPLFEVNLQTTPIWQKTIITGLFEASEPLPPLVAYLNQQQALGLLQNFTITQLADQDWERRCLDSFQPMQFGKRLWVCPSWHTPPDPRATIITLDPGFAFGTGTHPTTALCLEWLEANIDQQPAIIDYGCGSGILAIAALKLGAKQAVAVDYDPQAISATQENGLANHLAPPRLIACLPEQFIPHRADILLANILANPLIELAPSFAKWVKPGGKILLSGILIEQADQVANAYRPWFNLAPIKKKAEWVCIEGTLAE